MCSLSFLAFQTAAARRFIRASAGQFLRLRRELTLLNTSAVANLDEGVEEPLTLHRLGRVEGLGRSLTMTTCLESIMAQLG